MQTQARLPNSRPIAIQAAADRTNVPRPTMVITPLAHSRIDGAPSGTALPGPYLQRGGSLTHGKGAKEAFSPGQKSLLSTVRQGLRFLLSSEPGIEVAGEAADGVAALEAIRRCRPDVVLLDLFMLAKLGLADRTQAAIFALQRHLVPLDQALRP